MLAFPLSFCRLHFTKKLQSKKQNYILLIKALEEKKNTNTYKSTHIRAVPGSEQRCRSAQPRCQQACLCLHHPTETPTRRIPDSATRFDSATHWRLTRPRLEKRRRRASRSRQRNYGGGGESGERVSGGPILRWRLDWGREREMRSSW